MKFRVLTAVWGAERGTIPPGDREFSRSEPAPSPRDTILTTERDARQIQASPVFAALADCGQVDFLMIGEDEIDRVNPPSHWTTWGKGVEAVKKNGEFRLRVRNDARLGADIRAGLSGDISPYP